MAQKKIRDCSYSLTRAVRYKLVMVLLMVCLWASLLAAESEASKDGRGKGLGNRDGAGREEPVVKGAVGEWLPFFGSVVAAFVAGAFALYSIRCSTAGQRQIEREKIVAGRKERELAQEREVSNRFRRDQVLPFLEHLDMAITTSYGVVQIPEYFLHFGASVPEIRRLADKGLGKWLEAMRKMSDQRVQMLLAVDAERVEVVVVLLAKFAKLGQEMINARSVVWYKQGSVDDLWKGQREYVRSGYELMMEVKNAIIRYKTYEVALSDEAKKKLAQKLCIACEKGSVVAVPFGSEKNYSWVALWEIDTSPEWLQSLESVGESGHEEFEAALKEFARELNNQDEVVDSNLTRATLGHLQLSCMSAKLPSAERLKEFVDSDLSKYRVKFRAIWSRHLSPIEFSLGIE